MDAETLKIILELQRENTLYRRAISDILLILHRKHVPSIPEYDLDNSALSFVFNRLKKLYNPEEPFGQKPAFNTPPSEASLECDAARRRMEGTAIEEMAKRTKY